MIPCWYYGPGDGYLGRRHAASWHGLTPPGWPEVVDWVHPGIATADRSIPFGTRLHLRVVAVPGWAREQYGHLVGREAEGVVVDRMAPWVREGIDLWPALARELMGPDWRRIGKVWVEVRAHE